MKDCVPGIDVSHWQGEIDWKRVASAGIKFVIQKVTEGENYLDRTAEFNSIGCQAYGIKFYLYHFFRPEDNVYEQCSNFLHAYHRLESRAVAWLDVEVLARGSLNGDVSEEALAWLKSFQSRTANRVGLYTSPNFARNHLLLGGTRFHDYPMWVAHVGVSMPSTPKHLVKEPEDWKVWQHSFTGQVPGVKGYVDLNWMKQGFFDAT